MKIIETVGTAAGELRSTRWRDEDSPPPGPLRIAQVAPLFESVPPSQYGGTERVVSYLTEELVRQGHQLTLFASADSRTSARLVVGAPRALRQDRTVKEPLAHEIALLEKVAQRAEEFDLVHFHCGYLHFPLASRMGTASLTTLHGRLDSPDLAAMFDDFRGVPVIAISAAQRAALGGANWIATIHHGLPLDLYAAKPEPGEYLAFLGRVSPEKGLARAIQIARRLRLPLRIAAKIDQADREYYERELRPQFTDPLIRFSGEIGDQEKGELLRGARVLLFPIDWPEPFGLVMIEAMACGTPVVAYGCGSAPEVIDEGITGYVVNDFGAALRATELAGLLDRARVRERFEQRFSAARMARQYLRVYRRLLLKQRLQTRVVQVQRRATSSGRSWNDR
jgi:glycosyltransferase involved in cell wall biosynthesis